MKVILVLQVFLLFTFHLSAQKSVDQQAKTRSSLTLKQIKQTAIPSINFYRLTNEEGLSQASANVIFKDSEGFLWIGTDDGLHRYAGTEVKRYYYHFDDNTTIAANVVYGICEDKTGRIWVAHYN
ncbi:MAG: histidine kinase, partial [Segetibacter sp.]|nr:histidine kinase [Segetibacter sp.]